MDVLINRKKQKSVTLRVKDLNTLIVNAPIGFPIEEIDKILAKNNRWIQRRINSMTEDMDNYSQVYACYETILNGKIIKIESSKEKNTFLNNGILYINVKKYDNYDKRKSETISFIKIYANKYLRDKISYIGTTFGVCPTNIQVKMIRGKHIWGKCMADKSIIIDSRVIMLPEILQKYIIVHEFSHLIEFNHSKNFWTEVEQNIPNYKECRRMIRKYQFLRELY